MLAPFVANTDPRWFFFLRERATAGRLDEANFWSPKATRVQNKDIRPGDPFFLRLPSNHNCIAGYGFFAHFSLLGLVEAWDTFGAKNGDPDRLSFLNRIGAFRRLDLLDPASPRDPIGCTILRDIMFWPEDRWLPWGRPQGWNAQNVRGSLERDPERVQRLLGEITRDQVTQPEEFAAAFEPFDLDDRGLTTVTVPKREGQGTFRTRLLTAYDGRCAVTGEHLEPILEAAHVQPYLGPRSNHLQNGLLLTSDLHELFDRGYVTVTPEYRVRVSPLLRRHWNNGGRFYDLDGHEVRRLPEEVNERPSPQALRWHNERVFERACL